MKGHIEVTHDNSMRVFSDILGNKGDEFDALRRRISKEVNKKNIKRAMLGIGPEMEYPPVTVQTANTKQGTVLQETSGNTEQNASSVMVLMGTKMHMCGGEVCNR